MAENRDETAIETTGGSLSQESDTIPSSPAINSTAADPSEATREPTDTAGPMESGAIGGGLLAFGAAVGGISFFVIQGAISPQDPWFWYFGLISITAIFLGFYLCLASPSLLALPLPSRDRRAVNIRRRTAAIVVIVLLICPLAIAKFTKSYTDKTDAFFQTIYLDKPVLDGDAILQPYKGKWIKITGSISSLGHL